MQNKKTKRKHQPSMCPDVIGYILGLGFLDAPTTTCPSQQQFLSPPTGSDVPACCHRVFDGEMVGLWQAHTATAGAPRLGRACSWWKLTWLQSHDSSSSSSSSLNLLLRSNGFKQPHLQVGISAMSRRLDYDVISRWRPAKKTTVFDVLVHDNS